MLHARVCPIIFILGMIGACRSPLSPTELLALTNAEKRWAASELQAYVFETRADCFCDPYTIEWARVEVNAGTVTRVVLMDSATEVGSPQRSYFPTVETLFAQIRSAQQDKSVKDIVAEYDPQLGFPTLIRIKQNERVVDGGYARYSRNLTASP